MKIEHLASKITQGLEKCTIKRSKTIKEISEKCKSDVAKVKFVNERKQMMLNIANHGDAVVFDIEKPVGKKSSPDVKDRLEQHTRKTSEDLSMEQIASKLEKAEKQRLSASKDFSKVNKKWAEKSDSMKKMFSDKTEALRIKFESKLNLAEERRSSHI